MNCFRKFSHSKITTYMVLFFSEITEKMSNYIVYFLTCRELLWFEAATVQKIL